MAVQRPYSHLQHSPIAILASLFALGAIFYYFVAHTPLMADNFVFSRDINPGFAAFYGGAAVEMSPLTVSAAFRMAAEMYFTWCGRFLGNLLVYLLFMLPQSLYCLLATALFPFYILLLQICVFGRAWRQKLTPAWLFGLAGLIWLGIPSFGEAFLWLSVGGQLALIGQAVVFVPLRLALDAPGIAHDGIALIFKCLLFFLGSLLVTSLDFPTCAALPPTALACAFWLWFRRRKIPWLVLSGALGLCLGAAITLAAPGNSLRLLQSLDPSVQQWLAASWPWRMLDWLAHLPLAAWRQIIPLLFLLLACAAFWRRYGKWWPRHLPQAAALYLLPALLTHGAYLFTAWPPPRAFATPAVQIILCAGVIYASARAGASAGRFPIFQFARLALVAICLFSLGLEALKFHNLADFMARREKILQATGPAAVALIPTLPKDAGDGWWVLGKYLSDVSPDPNFWVNRAVASWYGIKGVAVHEPGEKNTGLPDAYAPPSEYAGKIAIFLDKGRISVESSAPGSAHVYYYGRPALLSLLPHWLGKRIFTWLARDNDWRARLVPILMARADIRLKALPDGNYQGQSIMLDLGGDERLWLVRPGKGQFSFDLLPLPKSPGMENAGANAIQPPS